MPAGSRATPWADAILQVDCVGRRAFWFNGGLGYESPRIRRKRNANFKHANRPGENQNAERIRTLPESTGRLYFGVDWAKVEVSGRPPLAEAEPSESMLLIGGPADGKRYHIPRDLQYFRVAERKPYRFAALEAGDGPVFEESFKTYEYRRQGSVMVFVG